VPVSKSVIEGAGSVSFTLNRSSGAVAQTVYVSTTTTRSANVADYTGLNSVPLAFSVGQTSKTVTINIANDANFEPDETFALIVRQDPGDPANVYLAKSTFTILNDDTAILGQDTVLQASSQARPCPCPGPNLVASMRMT